jgi:hypothetical protein
MADFNQVKIEGLNEVLRDLRRMKERDTLKAIRQANLDAAKKVAEGAKLEVPVRSGKLQRSIAARATQRAGSVKAGSPVRVPYAGPIHFGWLRHHIRPNPFLYRAVDKRIGEVFEAYQRQIEKVIERFNRG